MWYAAARDSRRHQSFDISMLIQKSKNLADARAAKWRAQKKKSTIRLVPDSDSLHQHLARANYVAYLLKHYQLQNHPSPIGHGWHLGLCLPVRSTQPPLPQSMPLPQAEIKSDESSESEDSDSDSCSLYSGSCSHSESCNNRE